MTVTLHLYEPDGTLVRNLTSARSIRWSEREGTDGSGAATFRFGDPALADLRVPDRIVIVRIDGTDEWAWLTRKGVRILSGRNAQNGGEVEVSGPGLRKLLSAARIYPPVDCVISEDLRERTFGVPDPNFDTSGLPNAVSFGTVASQPFATVRPAGMPDPTAELITFSTDPQPECTYYLISPDFTVDADGTYVWCSSADDEYDDWIAGMVLGQSRGAFQWEDFDPYQVYLCAGETFRIVKKVHNLQRTLASANFTWGVGSLVPASGDGKPLADNTIVHADTTATGGTFTLSVDGTPTGGLAHDISATNLQTALEQIVGAGNVTVSGSGQPGRDHRVEVHNDATGGTFQLLFDGQATGNIAHDATAATVKAAVEALGNVGTVTVTGAGTDADPWVITVTDPAQTSFTVIANDSLTGGSGTTSISTTQSGGEPDPWIIEFVGTYAYTPVAVGGDGSTLTGGVPGAPLTVSTIQTGSYAAPIIHTDTSWKVLEVGPDGAGMNFGEMFDVALTEAQSRGVSKLDHVTTSWTGPNDSGGVAWGFEYELTVPVETTSLLDLLKQGAADGYDTRLNPDLSLDVFDERGTDRTGTVTLEHADRTIGVGAGSRWEWDWDEPVNVVRSFDLQGNLIETADATSVASHGRYEDWLDLEGASAPLVGFRHQVALKDGSTPYEPARWKLRTGVVPVDDFHWGDLVGGEDISGAVEVHRVTGWDAKVDDDNGDVEWTVETVVQ